MKTHRGYSRQRSGAAIIETAAFLVILIPIVIAMCGLFGLVFGYGVHIYQEVRLQHAAQLGARLYRYGLETSEWLGSPVRSFYSPNGGVIPTNAVTSDSVERAVKDDLISLGLPGDSAEISFSEDALDYPASVTGQGTVSSTQSYYNDQLRFAKITVTLRQLPNLPILYYFLPQLRQAKQSASSLVANKCTPISVGHDIISGSSIMLPCYGTANGTTGPAYTGAAAPHYVWNWTGDPRTELDNEDFFTYQYP